VSTTAPAGVPRPGRGLLLGALPIAVLLAAWQGLTLSGVSPFALPPPAAVGRTAAALTASGRLPAEVLTTLGRVLAAFGLALVCGVLLGLLTGRVTVARRAARPLLAYGFGVPKIALYPAIVILFGLGAASKIALGFLEAFFPIVLATSAAASRVDHHLVWSARSFGVPPRRILREVVLPAALPGIATGARIGLVGAVIGVFVAEMVVSPDGLGRLMTSSWATLATAQMYVAVVAVAVLGLALDRSFLVLRRRLLRWSSEEG
jgi:NitT/TauT family transport system permease protein